MSHSKVYPEEQVSKSPEGWSYIVCTASRQIIITHLHFIRDTFDMGLMGFMKPRAIIKNFKLRVLDLTFCFCL